MPYLKERSSLPEKMDQPGVVVDEIHKALHELEVINKLLGGYHVIFNALEKLEWNRPLTIMDLGCGGGDMLRAIARWAEKKNREVNLIGVDRNPVMIEYASEHAKDFPNISFKTLDVFDDELMLINADVTMNSLFCHHFDDEQLTELIKRMNKLATYTVIVNDIHRHWFAYYSIKFITAAFSKTYLVKYDAALSVARSLTRKEWEKILADADIKNYSLRWMWAWRWQLLIKKETI
ncbi:MAG: methyltransferase domain-containing protein [Bacteroidia bacterium]